MVDSVKAGSPPPSSGTPPDEPIHDDAPSVFGTDNPLEPSDDDAAKSESIIAMTVKSVVLDPRNQTPIVILLSDDQKYGLPIWIGPYEATSIIMALEDVELPRPMTHDLMLDMIETLGVMMKYVIIHEVKNGTFFAEIAMETDGKSITVDARPSDSIALALRASVPILAERAVCDDAAKIEHFLKEAQAEQYKEYLEGIDPKDMSKYKM